MSKNIQSREKFFAIWGAVTGLSIGVFGNILSNFIYDVFKDTWVINLLVITSIGFLLAMFVLMMNWMLPLRKVTA